MMIAETLDILMFVAVCAVLMAGYPVAFSLAGTALAFAVLGHALGVFDMSDVVETEFGYHLILCTAKNPGKARKFEDVKEDVRAVYAMQLRTAVINQMKPKAQITTNPAPAPTPGADATPLQRETPAPTGTPAPTSGTPPMPPKM